jgi:hypothetical protein
MVQQHTFHPCPSGPDSSASDHQRLGQARSPLPAITTLAGFRASGHEYRGVGAEIRQNLLTMMRAGDVPELARIMSRLGMDGGESFGHAAAALEFTLEGLYLMRRLSKDSTDGTSIYRT